MLALQTCLLRGAVDALKGQKHPVLRANVRSKDFIVVAVCSAEQKSSNERSVLGRLATAQRGVCHQRDQLKYTVWHTQC